MNKNKIEILVIVLLTFILFGCAVDEEEGRIIFYPIVEESYAQEQEIQELKMSFGTEDIIAFAIETCISIDPPIDEPKPSDLTSYLLTLDGSITAEIKVRKVGNFISDDYTSAIIDIRYGRMESLGIPFITYMVSDTPEKRVLNVKLGEFRYEILQFYGYDESNDCVNVYIQPKKIE